jgi:hypothetical protein
VPLQHTFHLGSVTWQAFALEHSIAAILDQKTALGGVMFYIGDGASIVRPLLRP